jgi:hypothetical protein
MAPTAHLKRSLVQPDFKARRCEIEEKLEIYGHRVLSYPKFHCELSTFGVTLNDMLENTIEGL